MTKALRRLLSLALCGAAVLADDQPQITTKKGHVLIESAGKVRMRPLASCLMLHQPAAAIILWHSPAAHVLCSAAVITLVGRLLQSSFDRMHACMHPVVGLAAPA